MIQNIIVLIIVSSALAYSLFSIYKSLVLKKGSKCDGCAGCGLKEVAKHKAIGSKC
jgi:hypothetical protein